MATSPTSRTSTGRPTGAAVPKGMKRTRRGKLKKRNLLWRLRKPIVVVAVSSMVVASGGAYWVWASTELPSEEPPLLQTTFMCAADVQTDCNQDNAIYQIASGVDRVNVRYEQVPPIFVQALISAEDKDFFRHEGVDPAGIARALYTSVRSETGRLQGGSTLTQQYVKNTYLSDERSLDRKIKEAVLAIKLDRELPKQEILERYLNTIYFGRGAYGIGAASRVYFNKHVEELGLPEAAYLVGIIRQPESIDAHRRPDDPLRAQQQLDATDRRQQVLDLMVEQGYITKAARDQVAAMGWDYVIEREPPKARSSVRRPELGTQYFVDYVQRWLVTSGIVDEAQLTGGGLRIYTTLDFEAQQAAYDAIGAYLNRDDDPVASIVSIDDLGRVRAMVGGKDYSESQVNLAVGTEGGGSGRQPGSTFKAITLAQYLSEGKSLSAVYDAPAKKVFDLPGERWEVNNYAESEQGRLNVVDATRVSSNTAYAQIQMDTGVAPTIELARQLGLDIDPDPTKSGPSLVLGTKETSPLAMASAFSTFAYGGDRIGPFVATKVTNAQGQILWEAPTTGTHVLDPEVAKSVNWVLSQVVESGTGTKAQYGQPVAGKTGTTDDYKDAWFVGYTCKLTTAVWMGYPNEPGKPPEYMNNFRGVGRVAGGTVPTMIFQRFMSRAAADLPSCTFDKPADVNVSVGTPSPSTAPPGSAAPAPSTSVAESSTTTVPVSTTAAPAPTTTVAPAPTTVPSVPPTTATPPTTASPVGP